MKTVILPKRYVPFFPDAEWIMEASLDDPRTREQIKSIVAAADESLTPNQKSGSAIYLGTSGDPIKIGTATKIFRE